MQINDVCEAQIEALGFEGVSVARVNGVVVFVKGGLPGDRVLIRIQKKKKKYFHGRIVEILEASGSRVLPPCPHVADCGGCSWQHCSYEQQLVWKQKQVVDCFERIAKISYGRLLPIIASPQRFHYRNKMEFSFSARRWLTTQEIESADPVHQREFALGLHVAGRYDAVLDIGECHLQHPECNAVLNVLRVQALALGVSAYSDRDQSGFLRHLVLRRSKHSDQTMIILICSTAQSEEENRFAEWYTTDFARQRPDGDTVIHAVKDSLSPVAQGRIVCSRGPGYLEELSEGINFRISPFSFFQTNSHQLPQFLRAVFDAAQLNRDLVVWDLYCGTGSISLPVARFAKKVVGVELSEHSIDDARLNATRNELGNVEFYAADLHRKDSMSFLYQLDTPDVVILDPPRSGLHPLLVEKLLGLRPQKIVYVSCNPATQARDCAVLSEVYDIQSMQPLDMFPHTFHIENIVSMELRAAR